MNIYKIYLNDIIDAIYVLPQERFPDFDIIDEYIDKIYNKMKKRYEGAKFSTYEFRFYYS